MSSSPIYVACIVLTEQWSCLIIVFVVIVVIFTGSKRLQKLQTATLISRKSQTTVSFLYFQSICLYLCLSVSLCLAFSGPLSQVEICRRPQALWMRESMMMWIGRRRKSWSGWPVKATTSFHPKSLWAHCQITLIHAHSHNVETSNLLNLSGSTCTNWSHTVLQPFDPQV